MEEKILQELVSIRKELQAIRSNLELGSKSIVEQTEENGDNRIVVDKTAIAIKSHRINLEFGRCSQIS